MQRFRKLASMMGVEHAIILAPMAGGTSTPALVAAVSNARAGLGSLGAGYMTPEDIAKAIAEIRERTNKPFAVNLFAGGYDGNGAANPAAMLKLIAPWHERLRACRRLRPRPALCRRSFDQQLEVVLRAKVPVFSFTFGIPAAEAMRRMKDRGVKTLGTATTVAEARALEQAGADAIIAQGSEAGAHRGTFIASLEDSLVGTIALVPQMADAVSVPVIPSGGIMDGRGMSPRRRRRKRRATGNGFSGLPGERRAAGSQGRNPRGARRRHATLTRAFSGRLARGITNGFAAAMRGQEGDLLPYPAQNNLTAPDAHRRGPAGQCRLPIDVGRTGRSARARNARRRAGRAVAPRDGGDSYLC